MRMKYRATQQMAAAGVMPVQMVPKASRWMRMKGEAPAQSILRFGLSAWVMATAPYFGRRLALQ